MPIPLPPGELYKVIQRYITKGGILVDGYRPYISEVVQPTVDIVNAGHTSGVREYTLAVTATGVKTIVTQPADELWKVTHWELNKDSGTFTIDAFYLADKWLGATQAMTIATFASGTASKNTQGALELWGGPGALWQADVDTLAVAGNLRLNIIVMVWKITGKI